MKKLPKRFKGKLMKKNPYTLTQSRRWTREEEKFCMDMVDSGCTNREIAEATGRSVVSVSIKLKRLFKRPDIRTYNSGHVRQKYLANRVFASMIGPDSVLDLFCGTEMYWDTNSDELGISEVLSNDNDKSITKVKNHFQADRLIAYLYSENYKFDIVDLDNFGSSYDCLHHSIQIAQKGLIVTLGELGMKRFSRFDFVHDRYGIESMEDFTVDNIIKAICNISRIYNKNLTPVIVLDFKNISRVYFKVSRLKKTEQWKHIA